MLGGLWYDSDMIWVLLIIFVLALCVKSLRKAMGLLLVIVGGLACVTIVGIIFGVPAILIGGIFLFAK